MPPKFLMRYRQERAEAIVRLHNGSQVIRTSFGEMEYASLGRGPAVLISHGRGGGYDAGLCLARQMGEGFRFIIPSRFGYLRTPLPEEPTPESQADAFAALLDALIIPDTAVIGVGAGGPSALQFALRHRTRCRGLVMLSAVSHRLPSVPLLILLVQLALLKLDFLPWLNLQWLPRLLLYRRGISRRLRKGLRSDQGKLNALLELSRAAFPASLRQDGVANDVLQTTTMPAYALESILVPTLVIHATNDPLVPYEHAQHAAEHITAAQFLTLEDGGHDCFITHREAAQPVLALFLGQHIA